MLVFESIMKIKGYSRNLPMQFLPSYVIVHQMLVIPLCLCFCKKAPRKPWSICTDILNHTCLGKRAAVIEGGPWPCPWPSAASPVDVPSSPRRNTLQTKQDGAYLLADQNDVIFTLRLKAPALYTSYVYHYFVNTWLQAAVGII